MSCITGINIVQKIEFIILLFKQISYSVNKPIAIAVPPLYKKVIHAVTYKNIKVGGAEFINKIINVNKDKNCNTIQNPTAYARKEISSIFGLSIFGLFFLYKINDIIQSGINGIIGAPVEAAIIQNSSSFSQLFFKDFIINTIEKIIAVSGATANKTKPETRKVISWFEFIE